MEQRPLEIAVSGGGGLVGSALMGALERDGHRVRRLVRREPAAGRSEVFWDPAAGEVDAGGLRGIDAAVNLCGENLASGLWTQQRKKRIRDSRVLSTRLIAEMLAGLDPPPAVLINASAIGYYGSRGEEDLDETSRAGTGYLADLCQEWEAATEPAESRGIRVVKLRTGVVFSRKGGALPKMLPVFKLGLGGRIGDGRQFMSWIGHAELVRVIRFALLREELRGPLNAVAPSPVRNAEFTRVLAQVLHRPAVFPVPALLVRLGLGEMGRETLLSGAKVLPRRLEQAGYRFEHPDLESALRFELGRFEN